MTHTLPPMRLAVIGTGHIAAEHIAAIRPHQEVVRIVAASDIDPATLGEFCEQHSIPAAYADTAEMLRREQPDLVLIATPPFTHTPLAIQAMEAGAHVVCEKPMVISLAELDLLEAAERRTGRLCSSILQWRYGAAGKHVKQLIESGELGAPLLALCNTLWYRAPDYYTRVPWRSRWSTEGGGVALNLGIHAMDLTLWLMGEWEEVMALTSNMDRAVEVDTVTLAQVHFCSGAYGGFVNSVLSPRQNSYIRLDFQNMTIELDHLYRYDNDDWRFTPADQPVTAAHPNGWHRIAGDEAGSISTQWSALIEDFIQQRAPLSHSQNIRSTYEFLASLYKSAALRQPVRQGSILPDDPFYSAMNGLLTAGSKP